MNDHQGGADGPNGAARIHQRPFGPHCVFTCPRGRGTCSADIKPTEGAPWENHGTDDKPTLTPSYNCVRGCGWHGYIVDGQTYDARPGVITSLLPCVECHHPHLLAVALGRDAMGNLTVKLGVESLRKPSGATPNE